MMASLVEQCKDLMEKVLYQPGKINDLLTEVELRSGVKRTYIFIGVLGFLATYLAFGYGGQLICNAIGFAYPAYASFKALETNQREDDTKWLTYWVVYGFLSMLEFFSDILLSWFPLYWLAKCLLLLWCFAPVQWNGSNIIYNQIIRPLFLKYQSDADAMIRRANSKTEALFKEASDAVQKAVSETVFKTD